MGASMANPAWTSTPDIAGVDRQRERFGRRQPVFEVVVDQQAPHLAEGDPAVHQVLDVDAAVAQRPAVLVRLGDLGGERHHPGESGNKILGHR